MHKTFVTKPYLPPREEYLDYVNQIFDSGILTNHGPMVSALEDKLGCFLEAEYFHYVTNGTIALQLALKALDVEDGEVITTPFSYVATTASILWERCKPVFVDIKPDNFTIDPAKIEEAITSKTKAIMAVHVFGYVCDIEAIQAIANKYNLKVIYDGAHAFGVRYKGKPITAYGDVSTLSFHATKLFHTIEGGACVTKNRALSDKLNLIKCFGHDNDDHTVPGTNAKQDEFNAAMGLAILPHLAEIIAERRRMTAYYNQLLEGKIYQPAIGDDVTYNYAYYPVVFETEQALLKAIQGLKSMNIFPRRYFYPSLNQLPYVKTKYSCPISESISLRVVCLPLFVGLEDKVLHQIATHILQSISESH